MKPILVGLINPYSTSDANALAPHPQRSAGHRLWQMLNRLADPPIGVKSIRAALDRTYYMGAFERRNLFVGRVPTSPVDRHIRTARVIETFAAGSTVLLLGTDVVDNISPVLSKPLHRMLIHPQVVDGFTWRMLPHPSGRSTIYNDPVMRTLAGMMLADALDHSATQES